jgi:phage terminase large subunit
VGKDAAAYAIRHGSVILQSRSYDKKDVNDNCDVALEAAIQNNVDVFSWDGDGLGASLKREIAASLTGKTIKLEMFKGSESPDNPDDKYQDIDDLKAQSLNKHMFKNKRAQYYWNLRDRCYRTYKAVINNERVFDVEDLISFSSDIESIESLKSEICRIPKKPNNNGFIQIMTKKEMWDKHQIASPNEADCIMMGLRFPKVHKWGPLNYSKASIA